MYISMGERLTNVGSSPTAYISQMRKFIWKKEFFIKPILKHEADVLRKNNFSKYVIDGNNNGRYHAYYAVENDNVKEFLKKYHEEISVK